MIWLYITITVILLVVGVMLIPNKEKNLALKIITFPVVYVISMLWGLLTFPIYYFKKSKYNKVKTVKVKIEPLGNGKFKITDANGKEQIIEEPNFGGKNDDKIR